MVAQITPLPDPPARATQDRQAFVIATDDWLSSLQTFTLQTNDLAVELEGLTLDAENAATAAEAAADRAEAAGAFRVSIATETQADLLAITGTYLAQSAGVFDDPNPANNGIWAWNGATWVYVSDGTGPATAWGDITGKPSTFAPSAHIHAIADVTGLQAGLDALSLEGLRSAGQQVLNANATLDYATYAGAHILAATPGITLTLPDSDYGDGELVMVSNVSGGDINLAYEFASDGPAVLPNDSQIMLISDGNGSTVFWRKFFYSASSGGSMVFPAAGLAVSTGIGWAGSLSIPSGSLVGTTASQTLTNKTLGSGTSITGGTASGLTISGGTITAGPTVTDSGTVDSNSVGYRGLPRQTGTNRTLTANDNGKLVSLTGDATIPSTLAIGFSCLIFNNNASARTVYAGSGLTMYLAGTGAVSSRTLALRGLCSVVVVDTGVCVISGNV